MTAPYRCTDCGAITMVKEWPATRIDPADSTWGDGCQMCGGELAQEPEDIDPDEQLLGPASYAMYREWAKPPQGPEWEDTKGRTP